MINIDIETFVSNYMVMMEVLKENYKYKNVFIQQQEVVKDLENKLKELEDEKDKSLNSLDHEDPFEIGND